MKRIIVLCLTSVLTISCNSEEVKSTINPLPPTEGNDSPIDKEEEKPEVLTTLFTSTDKTLENTFQWAKQMALKYSHDGTDPVGPWYEAALPNRQAFCMRDVSHQTVGAQILGLSAHNANMLTKFAENITENKDWCSYWEINRYNRPAPEDYANDKEFWYNLNANFDVIQACLKLYQWTGNRLYLDNPHFINFYEKSLNEYIQRWMLSPDQIMNRPLYMNSPANFNPNNNFHTCRGLASYVENFPGLTASADLLASLYAGYKAYAEICALKGDKQSAQKCETTALQYRQILETKWWNNEKSHYYNFWTANKEFYDGEGSSYVLWFDISDNPERIRATMRQLLHQSWNVETTSYFPALFYRLGYDKDAYIRLVTLPQQERSSYPEVSYGILEGIAGGVMGITPAASERRISTLSRLRQETDQAEMKNVPIFGGYINIRHNGKQASQLENRTGSTIIWRASFAGEHPTLSVAGKEIQTTVTKDILGNTASYIDIEVTEGNKIQVNL